MLIKSLNVLNHIILLLNRKMKCIHKYLSIYNMFLKIICYFQKHRNYEYVYLAVKFVVPSSIILYLQNNREVENNESESCFSIMKSQKLCFP